MGWNGQCHRGLPPNKTAQTSKRKKGEPPVRVPPWTPSCAFWSTRGVPPAAAGGQGRRPWTLPPLKRRAKLSNARVARGCERTALTGFVKFPPKARFFGASPHFFAREQRNGVERAASPRSAANKTAHSHQAQTKGYQINIALMHNYLQNRTKGVRITKVPNFGGHALWK